VGRTLRGGRHRRRGALHRVHLLRLAALQVRHHGQQGPRYHARRSGTLRAFYAMPCFLVRRTVGGVSYDCLGILTTSFPLWTAPQLVRRLPSVLENVSFVVPLLV
jgi:hypothetical protein